MAGKRFFFNITVIALLLLTPWWFALAFAIMGTIFFPWYYELLLAGIIFDLLYGGTATSLESGFGLIGTTFSIGLFVVIELVKREWRT
jgi:hypothetical protein